MRHLLLVDDEPEVIDGLKDILSAINDITIHTAYLASQAVRLIEQQPISLVIADIRMPGMNGIEMWEEIRKRSPGCYVIFLSGVRDFDHIYRIIQSPRARFLTKMEPEDKILATVEETLKELNNWDDQQQKLQQRALYTYLVGNESEREQAFMQLMKQDGPMKMENRIEFAFFYIAHAWVMSHQEQRDALNQLEKLIHDTSDTLASHFIPLHDNCALWLFQSQTASLSIDPFFKKLQHLFRRIEVYSNHFYQCVYGKQPAYLSDLAEHYQSISDWYMITNTPQSLLISIEEAKASDTFDVQTDLNKLQFNMQALQGYLKLGQKDGFHTLVTTMFRTYPSNAPVLVHMYFSILAFLYQSLESNDAISLREKMRNEKDSSLSKQTSGKQMLDNLLYYSDETFEHLFPSDPYSHVDVISGIQRYILDHLNENLSHNALSMRFNMNPNYLSRLFRENTGHTLHDYITELRMGTAERILRTTDTRVNEIARLVGYDSPHTFIRAFKKQFNNTPAEYRMKKGKSV